MFDTHKNESVNNVIAYIAPKNKTMVHSMSLKNRISCVVGRSIFVFKTYWKQVFNFMEIQTTQTFKQFLQDKTLNAEKNKSYDQQYNVKRLRAFHNQAMMKQKYYENTLARRSGMDYIPGIKFQKSLINTEEAKEITMINQPKKRQQKRCRCGSIKHLQVSSKDLPVGLAIIKAKKLALGMGLSQSEAKKAAEDATSEEERKCLTAEAAGEGGKSAAEVTEDGYF